MSIEKRIEERIAVREEALNSSEANREKIKKEIAVLRMGLRGIRAIKR